MARPFPAFSLNRIPCLLFEDDDLLAVNKPAGIGTHRSDASGPPGLVELLQARRPGVSLGIHQRLDRATSGVIVFAKSARANASLAKQFEGREVAKAYLLATAGDAGEEAFEAKEPVDGKPSRTRFRFERKLPSGLALWRAEPETGRTHQVRLHAAAHGLPIVGDDAAPPLLLHAARLEIRHPATGEPLVFEVPLPGYFEVGNAGEETPGVIPNPASELGTGSVRDFQRHPQRDSSLALGMTEGGFFKGTSGNGVERRWLAACALREALLDPSGTNAFRLVHREGDGFPSVTVDRIGDWLYAEDFSARALDDDAILALLPCETVARGLVCCRAEAGAPRATKRQVAGGAPPPELVVRENGLKFLLRPMDPGEVGLFFDQRENRRGIGARASGGRVLNLFAYTCAFSVAAVRGGATEAVSVDASKRYLEWGRENFRLNGLDDAAHRFLAWDAREAVSRLAKRGERFRVAVLDPPSFGRSKSGGAFTVKRDFAALAGGTLALLEPGGWLLASVNYGGWGPREFEEAVREGARGAGRRVGAPEWAPQGFDFPVSPGCPAHLKGAWFRVG